MIREMSLEKLALGQSAGRSAGGEALYDQRLFNQTQGLASNFGADDDYTTYDKPLFKGGSSSMLYKPSSVDADTYGGDAEKLVEKATARFKANHEFEGTDESRRSRKGGSRKAPVEFEKDREDPFNLESVFDSGKGARRPSSALDSIGKNNNSMSGAAGSSRHSDLGRSGRKMEFVESETSSRHDKRDSREELRNRRLREKEEREKSTA
eukprot:TRINITY_DN472_c0_g1_i3.p1 TRINITY_DN472_c0_g1~~TRINITY_DN472_c0_g1_i3.p1  ORF type:complete len:209 (+),score=46.23 TRINITY_DN472_c0_g1_i3:1262-1888(+)